MIHAADRLRRGLTELPEVPDRIVWVAVASTAGLAVLVGAVVAVVAAGPGAIVESRRSEARAAATPFAWIMPTPERASAAAARAPAVRPVATAVPGVAELGRTSEAAGAAGSSISARSGSDATAAPPPQVGLAGSPGVLAAAVVARHTELATQASQTTVAAQRSQPDQMTTAPAAPVLLGDVAAQPAAAVRIARNEPPQAEVAREIPPATGPAAPAAAQAHAETAPASNAQVVRPAAPALARETHVAVPAESADAPDEEAAVAAEVDLASSADNSSESVPAPEPEALPHPVSVPAANVAARPAQRSAAHRAAPAPAPARVRPRPVTAPPPQPAPTSTKSPFIPPKRP